jgi:hypothetical protein
MVEPLDRDVLKKKEEHFNGVLADYFDSLGRTRGDVGSWLRLAKVLKESLIKVERAVALFELNERLNRIAVGEQGDDPELTKAAVMRLAVDAGLDLSEGSSLFSRALDDQRG